MNPENDKKYFRVRKISAVIIVLILAAGLLGWLLGRSNDSAENSGKVSNTQPSASTQPGTVKSDGAEVKSLVTYTLPDGWKEVSCPSQMGSVFMVPSSSNSVDCDANPSASVKISVDPENNKDCNQLQNVQNVSKHICIAEYINGRKSLKAETIYNQDSTYKKETTINAYYINTDKGVVKLEYVRSGNDSGYRSGFESLAKSVQVKG